MIYSVVICSFNKLEYLKRVVEGIKAIEGFEQHEYILSDDFSTDGTIEWAKEGDFFDKVLVMEKAGDYRLNSIRNSGIKVASNKMVVLLDADCMPQSNYFKGHDFILGEEPRRLSVGITNFFNKKGEKLVRLDHRIPWMKKKEKCEIGWMAAYGGNIAFSKKVWSEIGQFDEIFNGAWGLEDAEFAYRAHLLGIEIMINSFSVVHHLHHPYISGTEEMRKGRGPNTKKFKEKHGFFPC